MKITNKRRIASWLLLAVFVPMAAQDNSKHQHAEDSTDVFFRHLQLNELTVTGVTGDAKHH